ncbi:ankyrin repeat domain-containing protein [Ottowia thiooxydans]|uniref:ankyrin repeat domain-containing protein n=1 Tax=Ottowia thiooxydans TaxID=219182 RepID=UPI00048BBD70|nr:ankyrin repeat domain-containing protein [Ottowia thiooxydans]
MLGRTATQEKTLSHTSRSSTQTGDRPVAALRQQSASSQALVSGIGIGTLLQNEKNECTQGLQNPLLFTQGVAPAHGPVEGRGALPTVSGAAPSAEQVASASQLSSSFSALTAAIDSGNVEAVRQAIPLVAGLSAGGLNGESLLTFAAEHGQVEIVKVLREAGVHFVASSLRPASRLLMIAAFDGRANAVAAWMAAGADIHALNQNGASALTLAAGNGHVSVVKKLRAAGANILDSQQQAAHNRLKSAVESGAWKVVAALVVAGQPLPPAFCPLKISQVVNTRLFAGAFGLPFVIENLVNASAQAVQTHSPAADIDQLQLGTALIYAAALGMPALAKALRAGGASLPAFCMVNAARALRDEARTGCSEGVTAWLAVGVDVNGVDGNGLTALMHGVFAGSPGVVNALINARANLNLADNNGDTALNHAAKDGQVVVLKILLHAGASPDLRDNSGRNALHWTLANEHWDCADQLIGSGQQVGSQNLSVVAMRLTQGVLPGTVNPATLFQVAARFALASNWNHLSAKLMAMVPRPKGAVVDTQ